MNQKGEKYAKKAKCFAHKLHETTFSEGMNIYSDYVSMQLEAIQSQLTGQLAELTEWRDDLSCGKFRLNSIGTAGKCNHPMTGTDIVRDQSRCCRTDKCQPDFECNCPMCTEYISVDEDYLNYPLYNQHSVHVGIVNFWPLFYGLIDSEDLVSDMLKIATDPQQMMSEFGMRSLSKNDQFYRNSPDYFRGNIFVHLNYMLLRGLKLYYINEDESTESDFSRQVRNAYSQIREKIVETVFEQWRRDHQFWEMYDSETGQGRGTEKFNGWTSLILLIQSELYH